jgi:predicted RecB family nuclease
MIMQPTITSEVVVAYAQCPRKAYLLLFSPDKAEPHEYAGILEEKTRMNRGTYLRTLRHETPHVCAYDAQTIIHSSDVLIEATLSAPGLQAYCDVLTPMAPGKSWDIPSYTPTLVVGTHTITEEQKLAVGFVSYVLGQRQPTPPAVGTLISAGGQKHIVKCDTLATKLSIMLRTLQQWLETPLEASPPLILNTHCPSCPFRQTCRPQAEQEDNLSLLDHMTPKIMQHYHRKGIFTVHQLSYVFKPRRRRKHAKHQLVHFNIALQALAIRTGKIYVHALPDLPRQPIELFLDCESIPDQRFHYLLGLLICEGGQQTYHAFWADTLDDEEHTWHALLAYLQRYPEAPIYHYGSYEPKVITQLAQRYETPLDGLTTRLVNVNTFIYGKLYFPVRSNRLKELGQYVGASWTAVEASGLQSLVWRHRWEDTREETYKDRLLTYNAEDCQALLTLTTYLTALQESAHIQREVDFADQPKQHATARGDHIHRAFNAILQSAHATYTSNRIHLRTTTNADSQEPKKRGAKKGHQAYQRLLPTHIGKVIRVPPRRTCPKHKGEPLLLDDHIAEHPLIDLHFTKSGCRKTVTNYVGKKGYCHKCNKYYDPRGIEQFGGQLFGHALQVWVIYQRLILRLPYRVIIQVLEDMFGERASLGTMINFVKYVSRYYAPTERLLIQRLLHSPFIHADETRISIQGTDYYVWVFTDGRHVVFKMTATREATIVHEFLKHYEGILISDFYAGYDAVPCRQQKCLVHLIRDLNDDLWSNPFNVEFEAFVFEVQNLLMPLFVAVETYGLKRRHLQKFHPVIERFYQKHIIDRTYTSEILIKYQKRLQRYRDSLFTFLDQDGIPWQNNMAERALRHLAVQRKISGSFFEQVTHHFLLLLGMAQSCRFQDKSFLKFLLSKEHDIDTFMSPKRVQISRPFSPINTNNESS